jgi:hypothetical protein
MARIVMKFGGTSVGDIDRIKAAALRVKREVEAGNEVAVVVSAMSGETNRLVDLARAASPMHDAREYDVVVASGEQVTIGLMAMALQAVGVHARSWLGWQVPVHTTDVHSSARITGIDTDEIVRRFGEGQVAVVAGFQGVAPNGRILGATVVGDAAGELISIWALAIAQRLKVGALAGLVVPYPTRAEVIKRAASSWYVPKLFGDRTKAVVRFLMRFA